jgi:MFS family permease
VRRFLVLLGCFIGLSVATSAIMLIPLGIYMKPMTAEFGWSRTQFSMALAVAGVCNALALPAAGFLADRFGPPRVIALGVLLGMGGYAAMSQVSSFPSFVLLACFAVIGGSLAGYPAYLGLVQRWFDKRLGMALAIASAGVAVGVAGSSWAVTALLVSQGWRQAFLVVGCVALAIGMLNVVLLRDNRGAVPEAERTAARESADQGMSLAAALRSADFWLFTGSFALLLVPCVGINFHFPALLADAGGSPAQIAAAVGMVSARSLFGRLVTGILLDRWSVRAVATVFYAGQVIGLLLMLDGLRWALPAAFLLGAVQGAEIDLMGYVIARRFGRLAYARIFGTCFALTLVAVIISPVLTAQIYDQSGSYDIALIAFPILSLAALVCCSAPAILRRLGKSMCGSFGAGSSGQLALPRCSDSACPAASSQTARQAAFHS